MILNIGCYMTLCIAKKKSRKCTLKIMYDINKIYSLFFHHSYIMHESTRLNECIFLDIMTDIKDSKL